MSSFNKSSQIPSFHHLLIHHHFLLFLLISTTQTPVQLANLTWLSILDLSECELYGKVPHLPNTLKQLDVSGNLNLQPDLTRMFQHQWLKLQTLSITATKVIGSNIPRSISNAPMLVSLSMSSCSIQGSLPSSIFELSRLQSLELGDNNITGYIHSSISNLKHLNHLDLSFNNFQGSIPKSICEMSPLRQLFLNNNNITGTIPSCISKLQNLGVFHVYANSIDGNISLISFINELNIGSLQLGSNRLTVVIDQHVHLSNVNLVVLDLSSCNLKGLVPNFICKLTNLFYLYLSQNHLIGHIPSCLFKLKNLEFLILSNNKLSGSIPHHICSKDLGSKLRLIDISYNKLSGTIPTSTTVATVGGPTEEECP
ncbi:hypothetical protein MKW92_009870 [Papaver armeniacum]|nr:hypothetical protein MKW92_009870 [Papaver armeniacum]